MTEENPQFCIPSCRSAGLSGPWAGDWANGGVEPDFNGIRCVFMWPLFSLLRASMFVNGPLSTPAHVYHLLGLYSSSVSARGHWTHSGGVARLALLGPDRGTPSRGQSSLGAWPKSEPLFRRLQDSDFSVRAESSWRIQCTD
ncbi:unnamed protein product [Protopolystoma xenopodis]|uniref:Uncharacterized protein n=1 Tax=Protopolystoma xenopodis TaxID=117903 RepID=A0A448XEL7_9PLAT|nr:unnamed protein product [Protopolystoma xenopodis]